MSIDDAIGELLKISGDVTSVAILDENGTLLGSGPGKAQAAVGEAAGRLWAAAGHAAERLAREGLEQLAVESGEGGAFMVRDEGRIIVALTGRRPMTGLVFYDLHACLSAAFGAEEDS